jgi:hypothetical protein
LEGLIHGEEILPSSLFSGAFLKCKVSNLGSKFALSMRHHSVCRLNLPYFLRRSTIWCPLNLRFATHLPKYAFFRVFIVRPNMLLFEYIKSNGSNLHESAQYRHHHMFRSSLLTMMKRSGDNPLIIVRMAPFISLSRGSDKLINLNDYDSLISISMVIYELI